MRHSMTVSSNPRMIILFFIVLALPAVGVLLLIFSGPVPGIVALAAAAYVDYKMLQFFRNHLRSWVESDDSELRCRLPDGELLVFPWQQVTAAGYCTQERGRPFLFVYRSEGDKLVTVPQEYSDFPSLYATIENHTPFERITLQRGETIHDWLKQKLEIEPEGG